MARGDYGRVWFPEMLEELRSRWSSTMSWEDLADLCAEMTVRRDEIRQVRGYGPRMMRCKGCGEVTAFRMSEISIRSALFALEKNGIITAADLADLDARWKRHRAEHDLDRLGREKKAEDGVLPTSGRGTGCTCTSATSAGPHAEERPERTSTRTRVGRNDACPCGSGKKYKRCCLQGRR